jgi:hypothetical protein
MHLFSDVSVARSEELLDFVGEIPRHFLRRDVGESTKCEAHRIYVRVIHVTRQRYGNVCEFRNGQPRRTRTSSMNL